MSAGTRWMSAVAAEQKATPVRVSAWCLRPLISFQHRNHAPPASVLLRLWLSMIGRGAAASRAGIWR